MSKPRLTPLMRRTCEIYFTMKHPNQAEAYHLAGSKSHGNTLIQEACRTLKKPQCREYLAKLAEGATKRAERTADEVIAEIEKLAFSNMGEFVKFSKKKGVVIIDSSKLSPEQLACIAEVSEIKTVRGSKHFRFKLHDKKGPLELLAKKFNIIKEGAAVVVHGNIIFNENRPAPKCTKQTRRK